MINARRAAVLPSLALAAVLSAVLLPGTARAQFAPDPVTVDSTGRIAPDGSVTLTGTYYCSPASGPVLIDAEAFQSGSRADLEGFIAVCDGRLHRWEASGSPTGAFAPGAADAKVTTVELAKGGLPFPVGAHSVENGVTLVR
ncbi:DUF6299 family protein [Streptomyces qinzhouensis]|uniref:DUF6299 domain-containing protein n=1 Tax=Streptomyces qinzhouensis TaxID=2599401 RepID=A0A5B8J5Z9_9ACTN|nr:DUF6299 family protein [Streptomyces qinzhouensis]QDY75461.1 hypothetical protein FQU76_01865 [Streptomyces qinzhouensis]